MVHCRVVALSVSALQNGTRRFNSSQQMRILRLRLNPKRSQGDAGARAGAEHASVSRRGPGHRVLGRCPPSSQDLSAWTCRPPWGVLVRSKDQGHVSTLSMDPPNP